MRFETKAALASGLGAGYSAYLAHEHSVRHGTLDVAKDRLNENPVLFNGLETNGQIAKRIEEEVMPQENFDFWFDSILSGTLVLSAIVLAMIASRKG